ncbi:50S ribosomal protein L15 [Methylomonas sp. BW4-1]|uniref:Large ribosomal subunit protein uL15 n=1 Tax=Methylomonas defluvii TaxID=3045149 RepID=A0ABU4UAW5_9GAMM|nr:MULTISPECIES: 50S ribosomal protein L15 [unclassified Methylomonas]MDX8126132.1 50S ribosomal protein L15 [Methylomonas sp. OY6]PKD41800.1 50S ribosomal protein L15 [Methylomonas sp. Kb3]QBC26219.1 50S ribosomal protein L15 [Methylomonas sp. LW13]QSB02134.1 50S ribosomal protein L15 [Methylomonas sp. EFPC1]
MYLNTIQSACGARKKAKRVGRGIGSTDGKTCGRGHKGQKARSGGFHKVGFEGGQMPLQRRLPKVGFTSRTKKFTAEVRLAEIDALQADVVDIQLLISENIIPVFSKQVKVVNTGTVTRSLVLKGLGVTAGAKLTIEAAGGKVEA